MSPTEQKLMQQMLDRLIRLESRLVQLGDFVGANLRAKQKIEVVHHPFQRTRVEVDAMDVSLSRIVAELDQAELPAGDVEIFVSGSRVALLFFVPKPEKLHD